MRALGAVLAGGRSSRFGSDKAQALLEGVSLLDHARAALAPFCEEVVVCGHPHPSARVLPDRPAPDMGPLGGLNAALHEAKAGGFEGVLVTGCDMPSFPPALAHALIGEGAAVLEGQPLAAWWPAHLAEALDKHLAETSKHSIYGWIERVKPRIVTMPDLVLPNINRPGDLDALVNARPSRPLPR
ncbi:molybdenum cofactor guanylyltransferase [Novosphingobium terrae]|uniref:molybdenum cofactor guanylyltransferase n=1 Tax=Novosphingobium terrae TaxID=2726189 RepID=UPI00197DDD10|nr:molybdenum cofactor guanylyltransferase [Novosphingobium terrae]